MTAEAQQDQQRTEDANQQESEQRNQPQARSQEQQGRSESQGSDTNRTVSRERGASTAVQESSSRPRYVFNPQGAARAGLLNLATTWRESGATYQAISVYEEVLTRYPGSGAADAATEGLIEMARSLQQQGRFYTALNIFRKLEELV